MVKKVFLVLILALITLTSFAQSKPEWIYKKPQPSNNTYRYDVEYASGESELEARNQALAKGFQEAANRVGQPINSGEINEAIQNGTNFKVISSQYNIPISKVCEYPDKTAEGYKVYILFQIAVSGNIIPEFDDDFNDCYKMVTDHSEDWKAFRMSFFPGLGHIYKNHKALGYTIMVSDIALVCGGIGCYFAAQTYSDIMDDPTATASEKRDAESTYNMLNSASIVCYSAAAVLYIVNLWTAYTISDNRNTRVSFHPVISPNNKDIAFGIGASFKF